jgi:hypothetical protein
MSSDGIRPAPLKAFQISNAIGTRQRRNTSGLRIHQRLNLGILKLQASEILSQVQTCKSYLIGVAVEGQRRPPEELADTASDFGPPGW